jgi:PPOX class probable F420-dependent enzyme
MTAEERAFLEAARVARLATVDAAGRPSVIPICFQVVGERLYSAIDEKPKRSAPLRLKRVRNLLARPEVAVVADRWDEDWTRLAWVHVRGRAELVESGAEHRAGLALLRAKYPQYRAMRLEERPLIVLAIRAVRSWGDLAPPPG